MNRGPQYLYIRIFVYAVVLIILGRLFYIQIIDDSYWHSSFNNAIRRTQIIPPRGEVFDRNGLFLAQSKEAYDLMVAPNLVEPFDTLRLCEVLETDRETLSKALTKARNYSWRKPSVIFANLTHTTKLMIDELRLPGFTTRFRTVRTYPYNTAGNILGYMSEVNDRDIERDDYYVPGDYIGRTGMERDYEQALRGDKGCIFEMTDVHGTPQDSYKGGEYDIRAVAGKRIVSSIDAKLQSLGEKLMEGKIGSVVAIDPSTGEILAMVSSPTYNPDLLIGRERSKHYTELARDPRKPFFNRAVMAAYPPGSTFKMANGLIGLQEGVTNLTRLVPCSNGYHVRGRTVKCHSHASPVNLEAALQTSCNAYFCAVFADIITNSKYKNIQEGLDVWADYVRSFGFGTSLESDMSGELNGYIPSSAFYDRIYNGRWNSITVISLGIGQGEISVTPLQIANFGAIIANRGFYYSPHLVREIEGEEAIDEKYRTKRYTKVDRKYFEPVVDAMWHAVNVSGTGVMGKVEGLDICGKTGTAQNGVGQDHSTFLAFAPRDNPKIAISVYVEHGKWGATAALPIASLMIEQYLTDTITRPWLMESMLQYKINYPQYDQKK